MTVLLQGLRCLCGEFVCAACCDQALQAETHCSELGGHCAQEHLQLPQLPLPRLLLHPLHQCLLLRQLLHCPKAPLLLVVSVPQLALLLLLHLLPPLCVLLMLPLQLHLQLLLLHYLLHMPHVCLLLECPVAALQLR
jgi:hypothetical protein